MSNQTPLCIYHGNCADGFGAAWAVHKALPDAVFHFGKYGDAPPDVAGRDVIIVDFSYKRATMLQIIALARSVIVLDHHKSAEADLAGLHGIRDGVEVIFDMEKSGAVLAWERFHPGERVPHLLRHIQDRDLWRFALPGTREIQATVFSHPYDFEVWDWLVSDAERTASRKLMLYEGAAIERKHFKDVDELLKVATREMMIGGHRVPVANLPYTMASDAAGRLAESAPFAATYYDAPDGRVFSLRSRGPDGIDVSQVAAQYGGGGHCHASGFKLPFADAALLEIA